MTITSLRGSEAAEGVAAIELSICIPTLNRGRVIGETLESIIAQECDGLEIVIVDGASTDNTEEVVRHYQQRFSRIRYVKGNAPKKGSDSAAPSNGGFDRDCNLAVQLARGKYCWLFTDDDLLKPGAIQAVLNASRRDYGLIIVNAEVRSSDFSQLLEDRRLPLYKDKVYTSNENHHLFTNTGDYLTFVGGVVIQRELWKAREIDPYIGSGFIHFGIIFQKPMKEETLVIAEPYIVIRYGNALYARTSRYFEIWMLQWPKLVWSIPYYSDSQKSRLCLKEPWRNMKNLLLFRAKGSFSIAEYREYLEGRLGSRWCKIKTQLIAHFPGFIANILGVTKHVVLRRKQGQCLKDLTDSPFYFGRAFKWLRGHRG